MSAAKQSPLIFVTGASRSGTTLMNRLLGNHSTVLGLRELHYFGDLFEASNQAVELSLEQAQKAATMLFARQRVDLWHATAQQEDQQQTTALFAAQTDSPNAHPLAHPLTDGFELYAAAVNQLAQNAHKQVACEQTPRNIFYAKQLLAAYPNARIIHMLRDPRGVMASQKQRWRMRQLGANKVPIVETVRTRVNYHPITMSRLWNGATERALEIVDHPRVRHVCFEDLTADPAVQLQQVCEWLQLNYEPGMLDVPHYGSSTTTSSKNSGVSSSVKEQWRSLLTMAEQRTVQTLSGELMQQCGYSIDDGINPGISLLQRLSYPFHLAGAAIANPRRALTLAKGLLQR